MKAGGRTPRFVLEIEPVQAAALREQSTITLGIGAVAAASLLGVAMVLVFREARRAREERERFDKSLDVRILDLFFVEVQPRRDLRVLLGELGTHSAQEYQFAFVIP